MSEVFWTLDSRPFGHETVPRVPFRIRYKILRQSGFSGSASRADERERELHIRCRTWLPQDSESHNLHSAMLLLYCIALIRAMPDSLFVDVSRLSRRVLPCASVPSPVCDKGKDSQWSRRKLRWRNYNE